MRNVWFLLISATFGFTILSCTKNEKQCTPVSVQHDEQSILSYGSANSLNLQKHSSGIYYHIESAGYGETPGLSSVVSITYTGKLLNNSIFDRQMDASKTNWKLSSLIKGWQIGLPLIKKGGSIILIVPSALAYGCQSVSGAIPSNSVLVFDITLVDVR
jgi:FKBP-type peptidyl-prolyl cis-trans isomerase FkpA